MRPPALTRTLGAIATVSAIATITLGGCGDAGAAPMPGGPGEPAAATVPAHFTAYSASFISPSWGVVLGGTGCTYGHRCAARLVVTADGGRRWQVMPAPDVLLDSPASGEPKRAAGTVVFASRRDGWLYGTGLWATSDAGAHWQKVNLGGAVQALASAGGVAWAAVVPRGARVTELFESQVGRDAWTRVREIAAATGFDSLAAYGRTAWFAGGKSLWVVSATGRWHRYRFGCPAAFALGGIGVASSSRVAFQCSQPEGMFHTQKLVLVSANGGKTVQMAGRQAPLIGDTIGFAVPPGSPAAFFIAVITPGLDYVARSADGGKTWTQASISRTDGGAMLNSLHMVSPRDGWLVVNQLSGQNGLLRTTDAGRTWIRVAF